MASWQDLQQLLAQRVQEIDARLGATLMRFDNGLYLRVEGSNAGLAPFAELRFALFGGADRTMMQLPLGEAARHISGGRGYRFTAVVRAGHPASGKLKELPGFAARLETIESSLGATRGALFLSAATQPGEIGATAPVWNARAEFIVEGERQGFLKPVEYRMAAQRILAVLDDLKQLLLDSIMASPAST